MVASGGPWGLLAPARANLDFERLERYAAELERWNRAIRLVGPRDLGGIRDQVVDALLPFLLYPPEFPLLDIGSGAGLPGIPIAVAFPGAKVVCVEPLGKRVTFLRHAVRCLGLGGVGVLGQRAEDALAEAPELSGGFATVTGRAVAEPATFLALARPFVGDAGRAMLLRGKAGAPTVRGWRVVKDVSYAGPLGVGPRSLAIYVRDERGGGAG